VHTLSGPSPYENLCVSKIFRQNRFWSKKSGPLELSAGTFLDFSGFEPENIRPGKFQSKNFCDFQLSQQKFSGQGNFTAKKSKGFRSPKPRHYCEIYDEGLKILQIVSAFFQLSCQLFLDFSNFNRKIFWFFKFRAEKNPAKKISRQK
jgi:hypothetical protein